MKSLFLTGATGMLGHFLLRNCLLSGQPLIVLARNQKSCSAEQRLERLIANLEETENRYLPRPVVVAGNIHQPMLGLSPTDCDWITGNCDTILHSAASVKFFAEQDESDKPLHDHDRKSQQVEPYLSNVAGTKNLLQFCQAVGIENFHHVSTAYVCGKQSGLIGEQPVSYTEFGNDYEASKAEAEDLVRNASFLKSKTFLRPSIIVGDSVTGYSPSFHGIYTALQLGYLFLIGILRSGAELTPESIENVIKSHFVDQLGITGNEHKNLVPADWVSRVMMEVVQNPELHGKIYHITNHDPVSVPSIIASMRDAILSSVKQETLAEKTGVPSELLELEGFRFLMDTYRSYFCNDPQFDLSNTQSIPAFKACPNLNHAVLVNLWKSAINAGFSGKLIGLSHSQSLSANSLNINQLLSDAIKRTSVKPAEDTEKTGFCMNLQVLGPEGGSWSVWFEQYNSGQLIPKAFERAEYTNHTNGCIRVNANTCQELLKGEIGIKDALYAGHLYVEHSDFSEVELESLAQQLFDSMKLAIENVHTPHREIGSRTSTAKGATD